MELIKKIEEPNRNMVYLRHQKLNSIDHLKEISRKKPNNPVLPIIKNSLFSIFNNHSITNKESPSNLAPFMHLKTDEGIRDNRKKLLYNIHRNDFSSFGNHTNLGLTNELKYKLFYPKFNSSTLKGIY